MKFAKVLEQTLKEESIPEEWIKSAIQYKALKKCIGQVVKELQILGLEKEILQKILSETSKLSSYDASDYKEIDHENAVAEYSLQKTAGYVIPKLNIWLDNNDITGEMKENLTVLLNQESFNYLPNDQNTFESVNLQGIQITKNIHNNVNEITITLQSDSKFFMMLNDELNGLDTLKAQQEDKMIETIKNIAQMVSSLASPTTRRSDLYKWREVFKIYLDSEVYFRYNDSAGGERSITQSRNQLNEFISRIEKTELLKSFHKKKSAIAFNQFVSLNLELLKALQFQTINKTAITKILKKFDKRTSLNAKNSFPKLISSDPFINQSFAKTICAIITNNIIEIVPQLDDYICPICTLVAYKPIKLECGHVFCVRCLVILQKSATDACPMCRVNTVMKANQTNLDIERMKFLKLYFPKETKEKLRERAKEQMESVYGKSDTTSCAIQ